MIAGASITTLRARADLEALAPARATLAAALERGGWGGDDSARIMLVASEALSNAIEHGSRRGARIELAIEVAPDRAALRVTDAGRPGCAGWAPPAPPPDSSPRGRGLLIMRALADEIEVLTAGPGTELRVEFRREPAAVAA
jgi:anti-sigma regulatory factor (Ser/Thr protein kinase)